MLIKPEYLLNVLKKIPYRFHYAFISTFCIGILTHLYMLTNKFPNYDDVTGVSGYGSGTPLGRWMLTYIAEWIGDSIGNYTMPMFNGGTFIFLVAISAGLIVCTLEIQDRLCCILIGGIMITFPAVIGTFFFMFTTPYYGIGIFFAALAAYLIGSGKWYELIAGSILLMFSLAIYQAYYPLCAGVLLLLLIKNCLNATIDVKRLISKAFKFLAALIAGLLLYLVVTKVFFSSQLSEYKGISTMGEFDLPTILNSIKHTYQYYWLVMNPLFSFGGLSPYAVIRFALRCISLIGFSMNILYAIYLFIQKKKEMLTTACCLLLFSFLFPVTVFGIYIMTTSEVYSLMFYPLVLMIIMPLTIIDSFCQRNTDANHLPDGTAAIQAALQENLKKVKQCLLSVSSCTVALLSALLIFCYAHYANEYYLQLQLDYTNSVSFFTTLITQIKSVEGYDETLPVSFVGEPDDATFFNSYNYFPNTTLGGMHEYVQMSTRIHFMTVYCGYNPPKPTQDLCDDPTVLAMPTYPQDGSIQMVDGTVVVKFS